MSPMTRRDYRAMAAALSEARTCWAEHPREDYPESPDPFDPDNGSRCPEQEQWWACVSGMASLFEDDNPLFSRERFVKAALG